MAARHTRAISRPTAWYYGELVFPGPQERSSSESKSEGGFRDADLEPH